MVVALTLPEIWVSVTLGLNPVPELVEIAKPVGAVIVISAVKLEPLTVKLCWLEAEPAQAANEDSNPLTETEGPVAYSNAPMVGEVLERVVPITSDVTREIGVPLPAIKLLFAARMLRLPLEMFVNRLAPECVAVLNEREFESFKLFVINPLIP